jgi:hypothetical protein
MPAKSNASPAKTIPAPATATPTATTTAVRPRTRRAAARTVVEPAAAVPAPSSAPTSAPTPTPPAPSVEFTPRHHKTRLVRDSFTMPEPEYAVIDQLKRRLLGLAHPAKKSELLRAGIKTLMALGDSALLESVQNVPAIKTGRPKTKVVKKD